MRILADTNVPEEYVSALRGDGHDIVYSREVDQLGPKATDGEITAYAESEGLAILSSDLSDFGHRNADITVLVAPQDMSGDKVQNAVARIERLPFDPSKADPLWLTGV